MASLLIARIQTFGAILVVASVMSSASAQYRGGFAGGTGGLGNAGGFATGGGFSNGSANSSNFGPNATRYNAAVMPGAMQSIPGVSAYPAATSNMTFGAVPSVGYGNMGMGFNGLVPGIAPPGFTRDAFGNNVSVGGDSGFTDFGNALTYSALGLGYGGMGYGAMGYGPMAYGPMAFGYGPMGFTGLAPGMVPGTYLPGTYLPGGYGPVDPSAMAAINGVGNGNVNGNGMLGTAMNSSQGVLPPRSGMMQPGFKISNDKSNSDRSANDRSASDRKPGDSRNGGTSAESDGNANPGAGDIEGRRGPMRRSFLNDNVPAATANAIRIQNRLHNIKSPNFKNIKVLIAGRTALLNGTVDSKSDEQFAVRMVGLEPGVVEVKSELTVSSVTDK